MEILTWKIVLNDCLGTGVSNKLRMKISIFASIIEIVLKIPSKNESSPKTAHIFFMLHGFLNHFGRFLKHNLVAYAMGVWSYQCWQYRNRTYILITFLKTKSTCLTNRFLKKKKYSPNFLVILWISTYNFVECNENYMLTKMTETLLSP